MSALLSEHTDPLFPQPILRLPFPYKLYKLLDDADKGIHSDIVSWLPQGNGFKIHDSKAFCHTIMKTYFNQSKLKSFTRQLYLYGFLKVSDGPNEGAFFHPKFVRGDREGCLSIRRNQFEGDRRQSKQRTKNLLCKIQEAKANLNISSRSSDGGCGGGGVLLVDSLTGSTGGGSADLSSATTTTTPRSSCSIQFHPPGAPPPPPFDNRGEPFKVALTIFDKVFNLIDDEGSCDTSRRMSAQELSSSTRRRRLSTKVMRKDQEPSTSHSMGRGYSWDASYPPMNHSISADCLLSNTTITLDPTAPAGVADTDDDWLEKLEGSLGEPLLMRVEDEAIHNLMMESFDFSPRPIEEMFDCQSSSHLPHATNTTPSDAPPVPRSTSTAPVTMEHHFSHHHHHGGGEGDIFGVSMKVQRSRGLPV